jgi:hypothetical protein
MKNYIVYFVIILIISSCKKDELSWNLKRLSSKDAKLEVSEIIYSNNCSDQNGFQFIATGIGTPSSIYWDVTNNGYTGNCFKTQGSCTNAVINFNLNTSKDGILRFYFKTAGLLGETYPSPSVKVNLTNKKIAFIKGSENSNGEWCQMQTEILKAGINSVEIKFNAGQIKTFYVDEIELWTPKY